MRRPDDPLHPLLLGFLFWSEGLEETGVLGEIV